MAAGTGLLALFLLVVGGTSLPDFLLRTLEEPYAGGDYREVPPADAVVMLGGGVEASRGEVGGLHFNRAGDRVLMALELIRLKKAPVLVLGGGASLLGADLRAESDLLRAWIADGRRAEGAEVIGLGLCANTHEEAVRVHALAVARGWKSVLLVTSASHLRRATATFATAGVPARAAPCNFLSTVSRGSPAGRLPVRIPSWGGLESISVWLHEIVGWYEYRRRGWIAVG